MKSLIDHQPVCLSPRIRYRAVDNEGVLVHLEHGRVIVVNEVGLYILQQLDRPKSAHELSQAVAEEFAVDLEQAQQDVDHYLQELATEQILAAHA